MDETVTFQCGHTATLAGPVTFFRRCPACQEAWVAERAKTLPDERDALDDIFAHDSSDDARMPPPPTDADRARLADLEQEARERTAALRDWYEMEAWENP